LPTPIVHAHFAAASALAASDDQRPASLIEIALSEIERLLDAQPGPPEDHDETAEPAAVHAVSGGVHDGDDLLDLRRMGRVAQTLVTRRAASVESRHRRRRTASTSTVELWLGHDPPRARGRA